MTRAAALIKAGAQRRRLLRVAAAGAATSLLGVWRSDALAHRSHVTLTRVTPNPRTGRWEFVHAIHYHDALRLLAVRGVRDDVQPASVEGRARLALEIERGFRWFGPTGVSLQPVTVGAELEGDNVYVYQEMPSPDAGGRYTVETSLLHDVFPEQVNNISLEFALPRTTLRLSRRQSRGEFTLPSPMAR